MKKKITTAIPARSRYIRINQQKEVLPLRTSVPFGANRQMQHLEMLKIFILNVWMIELPPLLCIPLVRFLVPAPIQQPFAYILHEEK